MHDRLPTHDIVLVGAGHTNMHVARMWRMNPIAGTRLTIVSPFSRATYSGMLPGTLAGLYDTADMEIDLFRFSSPAGIRLIVSDAIAIDSKRRRVIFNDRPEIRYDVLSIGIGSVPAGHYQWTEHPEFLPIKPMATFRDRLSDRLRQIDTGEQVRVVVVGGGAAGVEVTFCVQAFLHEQNLAASVSLVDSNPTVLKGYRAKTIRHVEAVLQERKITIHSNERVASFADGHLRFESNREIPADLVLWATGASAPAVFDNYAFQKASDGFIAVRQTLQTLEYDNAFAVGDSATIVDGPLKKAGVYAVRQGPVLWDNLKRFLNNQPTRPYRPQRGFLSLLADGTGGAFLDYRGASVHTRWAWKLKDYIDRKFMRMYQDYRPMMRQRPNSDLIPAMHCKGCGGKAGPAILQTVFQRLRDSADASHRFAQRELEKGNQSQQEWHPKPGADQTSVSVPAASKSHRALEHPEDAAFLDPTVATAELISVDFFQAFMDDPWLVGRIAALNSLSDIWAMGAKPYGALAMIQLPEGEPNQQAELMYQVLSGSLHEFNKAGVELLGGHTIESGELTAGFTVLGTLDQGINSETVSECNVADTAKVKPLCKSGLQPGSRLFITKLLGSGVLLAGLPQGVTRGTWMDELLDWMKQSNERPAQLARLVEAQAVTDVTGFGLAGHLFEMLEASAVTAEISLSQIPLFSGVPELFGQGIESTLAPANRAVESRIACDLTNPNNRPPSWHALFDPQTSGGLLIGIDPSNAETAISKFAKAGVALYPIGFVVEKTTLPTINVVE